MQLLNISRIYLQNKAKTYPRTKEILSKFPDAQIIPVDSHWKIPELNNNPDLVPIWNKVKREYLVIGIKSGMTFQENGRSTDFIPPSHANGCAMACTYCYVARRKGYANPVTVFTNIDQIKRSIVRHAQKQGPKVPNQCDPNYWTYDIGCNNDVSVDAMLSDNIKDLVQLFTTIPNAKATFATKYVNNDMLTYDPQRKSRIRFSLMPHEIAKKVDVRTSSMEKRIDAINNFYDAGYEVHLNFSPIIVYDGWEKDYRLLLQEIDSKISNKVKQQVAAEVIFLTHNKELHEINKVWHPKGENLLWRPEIQEDKISLYGGHNMRYNRYKKPNYIQAFKKLVQAEMPYMNIRYIF